MRDFLLETFGGLVVALLIWTFLALCAVFVMWDWTMFWNGWTRFWLCFWIVFMQFAVHK